MAKAIKITSVFDALPEDAPQIKSTLAEYSWDDINKISSYAQKHEEMWEKYNIHDGDIKPVQISGTVSGVDLTGTYNVFILGLNHNRDIEGTGITFSFAKQQPKDLAFNGFKFNASKTNAGGWEKSLMRTQTCKQFFSILPKDIQDVIKPTIKYTDNGSGTTASTGSVTETVDKIFIPSPYEVFGADTEVNKGVNPAEFTYQKQYSYYKAGNSKIRYNSKSIQTAITTWLRSRIPTDATQFGISYNAKEAFSYSGATSAYGFIPCFRV